MAKFNGYQIDPETAMAAAAVGTKCAGALTEAMADCNALGIHPNAAIPMLLAVLARTAMANKRAEISDKDYAEWFTGEAAQAITFQIGMAKLATPGTEPPATPARPKA